MSYAVRNDQRGWRSVNGPDDVGTDEHYSEDQPAPVESPVIQPIDPVEKLRAFLAANPDVAAILQ